MAQTPHGSRWLDAVVALDAIAGAVLVIAGVYLIDPTLLDLGLYIEAGRYALAGGFLIYAGLVLAYAAVLGLMPPRNGLLRELSATFFGTLGRFCVGAIMLLLSLRAATADPPLPWIALLAIPGVLAFASMRFAGHAKAKGENDSPVPQIAADSGKTKAFEAGPFLWRGVILTVTAITLVLMLGGALYAYVLLDATLIQGRQIDYRHVADVISRTFWPFALSLGGLILAVVAIIGTVSALARWMARGSPSDEERDLSPEEISFISDCVQKIRNLVARHELAPLARRANSARLGLLALAGVAGLVLMFGMGSIVASLYAPPDEMWHLYLVDPPGSIFAALVLLFSWAFVPNIIAAFVSRRVSLANGAGVIKAFDDAGELEAEAVKFVRRRQWTPGTPFEPEAALRTLGLALPVAGFVWTVLLTAGVALWWPHDRALDTLYTDRGIETGEFWSMKRTVYPYAAVLNVRLKCEIASTGGREIGYRIVLPGNEQRNVVTHLTLTAQLEDSLRIDKNLRDAGVRFLFALPEEGRNPDIDIVDRACVLALAEDLDETRREKLEQLFHLDEWQERRWRQRTGKLYIAGS